LEGPEGSLGAVALRLVRLGLAVPYASFGDEALLHSEADFAHGMCSGCQEQMRQRISAGPRPSEAPAA
jgi:hypothetical protein